MDNFTPEIEILMRYLDKQMSPEEQEIFEAKISSDSELKQACESLQLTIASVKSFGIQQQVASIHLEMMNERKQMATVKNISPGRKVLRRIVAIAASVVFIVLMWQGIAFYNLSASGVFNKNYISYTPDTFRDIKVSVSEAEMAFAKKDYKKVVQLTSSSDTAGKIMLAGHAYLALNNPSLAVQAFGKIIEMKSSAVSIELREAAEYNLVLSYIRNRDFDLALDLMSRIKNNPEHLYFDKITRKLIRHVKMLKWR